MDEDTDELFYELTPTLPWEATLGLNMWTALDSEDELAPLIAVKYGQSFFNIDCSEEV